MRSNLPHNISLATFALFALALSSGLARAEEQPRAGAQGPSAITSVYAGQSSITFANATVTEGTVSVDVYGVSDQAILGSFQVHLPPMGSKTIRPEQALQSFARLNWDQLIVLYVSSPTAGLSWQHLRRDAISRNLVNRTVCKSRDAGEGGRAVAWHAGVTHMFTGSHTDPYASLLSLHNAADRPASYEVRLYDAATGEVLGRTDVALEARGSLLQSASWFQSMSGLYFPRPSQTHVNISFIPTGETQDTDSLILEHTKVDVAEGETINFSTPCPIQPNSLSETGDADGDLS